MPDNSKGMGGLSSDIPTAMRREIANIAKRRFNISYILALPPGMQNEFGQKIIDSFFQFKDSLSYPESCSFRYVSPEITFENNIIFSDGSTERIGAEDFCRRDFGINISNGIKNTKSPFFLIKNAIASLKKSIISQKEQKLNVSDKSAIIVFSDYAGVQELSRLFLGFGENIQVVFVQCGEDHTTNDEKRLKNLVRIESVHDLSSLGQKIMGIIFKKNFSENTASVLSGSRAYYAPGEYIVLQNKRFNNGNDIFFSTVFDGMYAKILYDPKKYQSKIVQLADINPNIDGIFMPSELLYNSKEGFIGYLTDYPEWQSLSDILYLKRYVDSDEDMPRVEIIRAILDKLMVLNQNGIYIGSFPLENFIISKDENFETGIVVDEHIASEDNIIQDSALPAFLWKIVTSGLSVEQMWQPLGRRICSEVLKPTVASAFFYVFQPFNKGKNIFSIEDWINIFA